MSWEPNLAVLTAFRSHDHREQLSALTSLKNEIVGNYQKKEKCVQSGVLEPVVNILRASHSAAKPSRRGSLTGEETARLHALQILGLFANGGFVFLQPLHAAGAFSAILSNISPVANSPQVVSAALTAAIDVAEVTTLALPTSATSLADLADVAFVPSLLEAYRGILTAPVTTDCLQSQRNSVAKFISLLCREEPHQVELADCGILDALATNLASVIVACGCVIPGAEAIAQSDGVPDLLPEPAAAGTDVTAIFEALSAIIGDSRWRASALIHAPAMLAVFPHKGSPSEATKACADALQKAGLASPTSEELGLMDSLNPVVAGPPTSTISPNGSGNQPNTRAQFLKWMPRPLTWDGPQPESSGSNLEGESEETESPLIPWLIYVARSSDGMKRTMAASIVTTLFKAGLTNRFREASMGLLVLPILLSDLEKTLLPNSGEVTSNEIKPAANRSIVERNVAVLARLVVDNDFLQKRAFECSGVKIISALLKGAYEPTDKSPRPWSPTPLRETGAREIGLPTNRLGNRGQSPLLAHRIRVREVALKAVAALAGKDDYGRAFVDQNLVPFIVESLSATPSTPTKDQPKSPRIALGQDDGTENAAFGTNPTSVIVAACHALRTLSRSVNILRTTLQDCGVVSPAFRLLRHPDIEIQIAASALMCNLVTNVSPMRDRLDGVGVMRVLCQHTKSENPLLRLNALWALKHWVDGASFKSKKECLQELDSGWLVKLIRDDAEDEALYHRTAKNEKQVATDMDEDVEMTHAGEEGRTSVSALLQHSPTTQAANGQARTPRLQQAKERVANLREAELSSVRKVRDDDLAIQEQGLNFLRNLIGPVKSVDEDKSAQEHADMIEHLFQELSQDRFFEILQSKLQLKYLHPFGRKYANTRQDSRVLYPQARIVSAVIYILVHVAASAPTFRQILISQTKLLTELGKHFQSKDKDVRVALCHLIANLTWREGPGDDETSRARADQLRKLGLLTKLETLENDDGELDVRERAKGALFQINKSQDRY